jgi:UrcA family protein
MIKLPLVVRAAAVAVAALLTTTVPALASPVAMTTEPVTIRYSDLDLAKARDQVRLQNRIETAIRSMCGAPIFGTADEADWLNQCRADAQANAEPKLRAILASAAPQVASTR